MANITMRDFINQCQLYEHSAEHYELMKECSELVLLEQYIDNQLFLMDSSDIMESADVTFEEGYFQESASESSLESIMEAADEKKKNIFSRIWESFKKLVRRFAAFLYKCAGGDDPSDLSDKVKSLKKKVKENKELNEKLNNDILALCKQYGITYSGAGSVSGGGDSNSGDSGDAGNGGDQSSAPKGHRQSRGFMSAHKKMLKALNNLGKDNDHTFSVLDGVDDKLMSFNVRCITDANTKACDPSNLTNIVREFSDMMYDHNMSSNNTTAIRRKIEGEITYSRNNGITFVLDKNGLSGIAKKLESSIKEMDATKEVSNPGGSGDVDSGRVAQDAAEISKLLHECFGDTSAVLTKIINVRRKLIGLINTMNTKYKAEPKQKDNQQQDNSQQAAS